MAGSEEASGLTYRMAYLGQDDDGRHRWRGTGFCLSPGGLTQVDAAVLTVLATQSKQRFDKTAYMMAYMVKYRAAKKQQRTVNGG